MMREATGSSHRSFGVAEAMDPEREKDLQIGAPEPVVRGRGANA